MKWTLDEPKYADMVRINFGSLYHFGIYVSDNEIIQFGLAPGRRPHVKESEVEVLSSDAETFCGGQFMEVAKFDKREQKKRFSPEKTVEIARSRLGERGYNMLHNNCEHFAYECTFGKKYCSQTEAVKEFLNNLPLLHVYISTIPDTVSYEKLTPKQRQKEVLTTKDPQRKLERYFVWKLLEHALEKSLHMGIKEAKLRRTPDGKWKSPFFELSIAHTDGTVSVAISREPVGIDIENVSNARDKLSAELILNNDEIGEYKDADALTLLELFAQKESIFKMIGTGVFEPRNIYVSDDPAYVRIERITNKNGEYILAISSKIAEKAKIFNDAIF